MNKYLSSASLKSLAKGQLLGKYGTLVGAYLLHMVCVWPVTMAVSFIIDINTLWGVLFYCAASFVVSLFAGFFLAGEAFIYLKLASGHKPVVTDLFYCFHGDTKKVVQLQMVIAGISTVCSLPAMIAQHFLMSSMSSADLSASSAGAITLPFSSQLFFIYVLFYLVGTVIDIAARLMLSQVFYLMLDFPNYTAGQLLRKSIRIMKGSMARLFYIDISFIPLILLSMLSCGIGLLWLLPYMEATCANFYLDLIRKSGSSEKQVNP